MAECRHYYYYDKALGKWVCSICCATERHELAA
jgi:hypothetical protein